MNLSECKGIEFPEAFDWGAIELEAKEKKPEKAKLNSKRDDLIWEIASNSIMIAPKYGRPRVAAHIRNPGNPFAPFGRNHAKDKRMI